MHKNSVWLGFVAIIAVITLYFCFDAAQAFRAYQQTHASTTASLTQWQVVQSGADRYVLSPTFRFSAGNREWEVNEVWEENIHRNRWAAEQAIEAAQGQKWTVHYNPSFPQQATLMRHFPTKKVLSAALLVGLLCYFIGLGYYVGKMAR